MEGLWAMMGRKIWSWVDLLWNIAFPIFFSLPCTTVLFLEVSKLTLFVEPTDMIVRYDDDDPVSYLQHDYNLPTLFPIAAVCLQFFVSQGT